MGTSVEPHEHVVLHDARVEAPLLPYDHVHGGGPVTGGPLPDWVYQVRDGAVVGRPAKTSTDATYLAGSYVWGGWAGNHPGHFMAEHAPRLLFSARQRPDDRFLFLRRAGAEPDKVPAWFWGILDWFGIARERVEFVVDTPVVVEQLTVFPQAEHVTFALDESRAPELNDVATPRRAYLDALDQLYESKGLDPWENEFVYLSRAGLPGRFGGERYLERALVKSGVLVVRPEDLSIPDQVRLFAGAKNLVFAEGSAIHFRQLLGFRDQTVTILQRRPVRRTAINQMRVRCSSLAYRPVVLGVVQGPYNPKYHVPQEDRGFPYTDAARLLDTFKAAGVDLGAAWDADAFDEDLRSDMFDWAGCVRDLPGLSNLRVAYHAELSLMAMGAISLAPQVGRAIEPSRAYGFIQDTRVAESKVRALESALADTRLALSRLSSGPLGRVVAWDSRVRRTLGATARWVQRAVLNVGRTVAPKLPRGLRARLGSFYSRWIDR